MIPRSIKRLLSVAPVATVATAAITLSTPAVASAATDACEARGSRTEEASRFARVYSVRRVQDDAVTRRWYACLYSRDRRVHLGDVGPGGTGFNDRISPVQLSGRYVAAVNEFTAATGDAIGAIVQVRDLGTGRFVHRFSSPSEPNTYDVTDLELRSDGSVAWIARILSGTPATTTFEVRKLETFGAASEVVDQGAAIARRSLALSGSTLYWTNADAPRSSTLDR